MQNGTETLFRGDEVPVKPILCAISSGQSPKAAPWIPLMLDLFSFSRLLNETERGNRPKLNPLDYTETLLSLLYRLVEVSPLRQRSNKSGGLYGDVIYLAMLAFMTTLLPEYTRDGSSIPLLSDRLGSALQDVCIIASDFSNADAPLLLWILLISGISVLNPKENRWLSLFVTDTCERLELDSWADIQQQQSQFPWISALHDAPARQLKEAVRLGSRESSWDRVISWDGEISWDNSSPASSLSLGWLESRISQQSHSPI